MPWNLALGLSAALLVFIAYNQSFWWVSEPDYFYGFLTPLFCLTIVCERWPLILRSLAAAEAPGSARADGLRGILLKFSAIAFLALGCGGIVAGSLMRTDGMEPSAASNFTVTLGGILAIFGLLFVCVPASRNGTASATLAKDARLGVLALFIYPVGVWMLSARLMGAVEIPLSLFLQARITGFVSTVFDLAGASLIREGNVLLLPGGPIGVSEACSGIRSLTGSLFTGAFLGAAFFRTYTPKVLLLLAAILMAFLSNLARTLFLCIWSYQRGPHSIEGMVHDATGYAVLALSTLGLLVMVGIFKQAGRIRVEFSKPGGAS